MSSLSLFTRKQPENAPWPDLKRIDPEAVSLQPDPLAIEARPLPVGARSTVYVIGGLLLTAIVWASLSQIDRTVVARGKIITVDPLMVVQPLEVGVIRSLNVGVGDVVHAGTVLATLDPTFTQSEQFADREKLSSLDAESQRLHAEIFGQPFPSQGNTLDERDLELQTSIFAQRQAEYRASLASDEADIAKLEAQIVTNEASQAGMKERLKHLEQIQLIREQLWDSHLGTLLSLEQSRLDRLTLTDQLTEKANQHKELLQQLEAAKEQKEKFAGNWSREAGERLTDTLRQLSAARQQLNVADRRHNLVTLRAPADGVVLEIAQRSIGSVVREAEALFTLVPLNSAYEAEVEVESADIAALRVGDPVRVKLESLPYQRHGLITGRVRTITEASFPVDSDAQRRGNDNDARRSDLRTAYFRSRIALGPVNLQNVPADFRLIPGMTTTAEIVIGKRSIISYVLYPIFRVFNEGLREP